MTKVLAEEPGGMARSLCREKNLRTWLGPSLATLALRKDPRERRAGYPSNRGEYQKPEGSPVGDFSRIETTQSKTLTGCDDGPPSRGEEEGDRTQGEEVTPSREKTLGDVKRSGSGKRTSRVWERTSGYRRRHAEKKRGRGRKMSSQVGERYRGWGRASSVGLVTRTQYRITRVRSEDHDKGPIFLLKIHPTGTKAKRTLVTSWEATGTGAMSWVSCRGVDRSETVCPGST